MARLEDKIMSILSDSQLTEEASYEVVGGPTPTETLKAPLDYAKNVKQATVPQAFPIPGVGKITDDAAGIDEEDVDKDEDDDKDKVEESFASLLARLAEEEDDEDDKDEDDKEDEDKKDDKDADLTEEDDKDEDDASDDSLDDTSDDLVVPAKGAKAPELPEPVAEDEDEDKDDDEDDEDDEDDKKKEADVKEDIDAIFTGVSLTEATKIQAGNVFKAAVARRTNEEKQRVLRVATKKLKEAFAILSSRAEKKQVAYEQKLAKQVDGYLNYVVEEWMTENRLAVERGVRAEIAESFISGLKSLFVEHYIEVPESKVDVVATLGKKVTKLEAKLNESVEANIKMRSSLNSYRKEEVVRAVSSGLADTQREKLSKLAEGVEYSTRKQFAQELTVLREAYFAPTATPPVKEQQPLLEAVIEPTSEMAAYTKTLARMKRD